MRAVESDRTMSNPKGITMGAYAAWPSVAQRARADRLEWYLCPITVTIPLEAHIFMKSETIGIVVESVFPEDCAVIGRSNFEQLLNSKEIVPVTITGGHAFSIHASLEIVAAATIAVRQLILLHDDFRARYKRKPTEKELSELGTQSKAAWSEVLAEHFSKLVEAVEKIVDSGD